MPPWALGQGHPRSGYPDGVDASRLLSLIQATTVAARELQAAKPSRELALTITKLDEAHMWAGRSMAVDVGPLPSSDELVVRLAAD